MVREVPKVLVMSDTSHRQLHPSQIADVVRHGLAIHESVAAVESDLQSAIVRAVNALALEVGVAQPGKAVEDLRTGDQVQAGRDRIECPKNLDGRRDADVIESETHLGDSLHAIEKRA